MGSSFWCKKCKYVWKSKKHKGRPSHCPKCKSKRIVYDCTNNFKLGWMVGVTGTFLFSIYLFGNDFPQILGAIGGIIGIPVLIGVILGTLSERSKNKKILEEN